MENEPQSDATVAAATTQGKVTGIIYPPPDIRAIVDKTAQFVARSGRSFERKIATETASARFAFLNPSDPYHAYYEHKINEFVEKANAPPPAPAPAPTSAPASGKEETATPAATDEAAPVEKTEPPPAEPRGDVVVEKKAVETVTAKVAKKLREKALQPPAEEKFKIKHPHLSALDQEIMYVTAQYTALSGKTFLAGLATREQRNPQFDFLKPTHALFAYFTALVESYALVLGKSDDQMQRIEEGMDRMKVLDRCVHKLEWMRQEQEQKDREAAESDAERLALSQIDWHDFVVVETITFNDDEDAAALEAAQANGLKEDDDDMDMDMEDDDSDDDTKPEIKVVQDYVPLASSAQPAGASATSMLTVDGTAVSSADANEHMRILLMNPKWREEQQRHLEKQKESSYAAGVAIADSLKRFANKRVDIFSSSADEEARLQRARDAPRASAVAPQHEHDDDDDENDESTQAATERTGAPVSSQFPPGVAPPAFIPPTSYPPYGGPPGMGPPGMAPPGMAPRGMGPPGMGPPGMGPPGMGPGMGPPGMGMGPPGMGPPGMGPPGMGPPGMGPPGVAFPPPGSAPPGVDPSQQAPTDGEPAAKRQRTDGSSLLTEVEFAALHPGNVRVLIKVPHDPENEQWKLNGQTLTLEIDVKATMRDLKQKIANELGDMPVNKQQLKATVGFVKDSLSCAHYNFVNGTVLELSSRQRGGRR